MKIMHLVLTPRVSGAEMLVVDLVELGARDGHEMNVCALAPSETSFEPIITRTKDLGVGWLVPPEALGRRARPGWIRRQVNAVNPDVLFAHSVIPSRYARLALLFARRPRIVSVLHSACQNDYGGRGVATLLERIQKRRADAIVTVSRLARENYVRVVGEPVRIETIPNGIHIDRLRDAMNDRKALRQKLSISGDNRILLQVGRVCPTKQQHLSIAAVAHAACRSRDLHLWIAGIEEDPHYCAKLREQAKRLSLSERVKFLGPRDDVHQLLAATDVFLMPSEIESQGIAFLEGLASGNPVVASDIDVFQFARNTEGVWLCDVADADTFAKAIAMATAAGRVHRDLDEFDIERTHRSYMELAAAVSAAGQRVS